MSFTAGRYTVVPPIPFIKEAKKLEQSGDFFEKTIYLPVGCNNKDANKAEATITLRHFSSGTTEEWIKDYKAFMGVCALQKTENLFTSARIFLKGYALSKFDAICNEECMMFNNVAKENFDIAIRKLSVHLMPLDSLSTQKNYMIYYCRKPAYMKFRSYLTRLCEMNDYLTHFPPNFCEDQKFSERQIIDIVNFGMPCKWKLKFATTFGTVSKESITLELLLDFGERQEIQESFLSKKRHSS